LREKILEKILFDVINLISTNFNEAVKIGVAQKEKI
jgi:hypothetical protein